METPYRGVTASGICIRALFKALPNDAKMQRFALIVNLLDPCSTFR